MTEPDVPEPAGPKPRPGGVALVIGSALLIIALIIAFTTIGSGGCERQDVFPNCLIPMFWAVVLGFPGLIVFLVGLALRLK
jgi:hypothetical protein